MGEDLRIKVVSRVKRIVVKLGSQVLTDPERGLDELVVNNIAGGVSSIRKRGIQVIIVTSGAVAAGIARLGLKRRPHSIPEKQAVAALGQSSLMWLYEKSFTLFSERVAQVLLTHDDLSNRKRFLNARNTLFTLLQYGIIPIINENDTVAVDEIKFGDNDYLSALAVNLIEADMLILLSHVNGLYDKDPERFKDASFIPLVERITPAMKAGLEKTMSSFGTGGMVSKIDAAEKVCHFGVPAIIASGKSANILEKIFEGESVGTLFLPSQGRPSSRKHWIAYALKPAGRIVVDDGARRAILEKGKSLLPSGVTAIEGRFKAGEAVICIGEDGAPFARGLVNYSSKEVEDIKGLKTSDIEKRLGYKLYDEVIHRDNLAVL